MSQFSTSAWRTEFNYTNTFASTRGNALYLSQRGSEMKEGFLYLNCLSAKQSTTSEFVIAIAGRGGDVGSDATVAASVRLEYLRTTLDTVIISCSKICSLLFWPFYSIINYIPNGNLPSSIGCCNFWTMGTR